VTSVYWGASATAWAAWTAIGTLALASATVAAIWVGVRQRRADREDYETRLEAERHERQDADARQVNLTMEQPNPVATAATIIVSAPVGYVLKQLAVQLATTGGAFTMWTDTPVVEERDGRVFRYYAAQTDSPGELPMISFTDWQGAFYYQYGGNTRRFPAGTGFDQAFRVLRAWLLSGPDGEQPPPSPPKRRWLNRLTHGRLGS
jgi:hypothetical protein